MSDQEITIGELAAELHTTDILVAAEVMKLALLYGVPLIIADGGPETGVTSTVLTVLGAQQVRDTLGAGS